MARKPPPKNVRVQNIFEIFEHSTYVKIRLTTVSPNASKLKKCCVCVDTGWWGVHTWEPHQSEVYINNRLTFLGSHTLSINTTHHRKFKKRQNVKISQIFKNSKNFKYSKKIQKF